MIGARLIFCGCLALLSLPAVAAGQARGMRSDAAEAQSLAPSVSVRELRIPEKARGFYNKGVARFATQDWARSIPEFRRAIAAYADFYEAYYKIGIAELELQLGGEAEAAFRTSIALSEGRFAPALFALGLTLGNAKQFDDALDFIRAGLTLEPTSARGHFTMAWVLYAAERVAEAEKSARQAVLYGPNFATAYLLLGQIHRRQNNAAGLVEDLGTYLRLEPNGTRSTAVRAVREEAQRDLELAARTVAVASAQR